MQARDLALHRGGPDLAVLAGYVRPSRPGDIGQLGGSAGLSLPSQHDPPDPGPPRA